MPTFQKPSRAKNRLPAGRLIGSASNILLLGFLAGVFAGYSMPPATMNWVARFTLAGFAVSVIFTLAKAILQHRAQQKAFEHAKLGLEQRMERLIPSRRVIAHGTHSHRPHKRDDETEFGRETVREILLRR